MNSNNAGGAEREGEEENARGVAFGPRGERRGVNVGRHVRYIDYSWTTGFALNSAFEVDRESNRAPVVFRTIQTKRKVGSEGGIIRLAGCRVSIPSSEETRSRLLTLKMIVSCRRSSIKERMVCGPEIILQGEDALGPDPAVVEVATCYELPKPSSTNFTVDIRRDRSWVHHHLGSLTDYKLEFPTREFDRFRFRFYNFGARYHLDKSIAHTLYIKEGEDNKFSLTWCFYDNLPEATLEVKKRMALNGFHTTDVKGSLSLSWRGRGGRRLEISLKSHESLVKDFTALIQKEGGTEAF